MKKYISCIFLIFIFIGVMQVSTIATPLFSYPLDTQDLFVNTGNRAAQFTRGFIGPDFRPTHANWTDIAYTGFDTRNAVINVPHDATFINFLYWDFGSPNNISPPNHGWNFHGDTIVMIDGIRVGFEQLGNFFLYTPRYRNATRALGRHIAINTNHFRRENGETVTIERSRFNTAGGQFGTTRSFVTFTINWTGAPLPQQPSPTGFTYNDMTQLFSGVTTSMEYSVFTTSWSAWTQGTGQPISLSPFLSTNRVTDIAVRYRTPSAPVGFRVNALAPAPTHLSIIWENGNILLRGFKQGHSYAYSRNPNFSQGHTGETGNIANAGQRINLNAFISPGDFLYVREVPSNNNDADYSDYVRLRAPTAQVPNTIYDITTHELYFPTTGTHWVRFNSDSDIEWLQLNIPAQFTPVNMYPFLSAESETRIDITAPWSFPAFQTIIVPALESAPDLWFEWISDLGLVLWGFEIGSVYDFAFDAGFYDLWTFFESEFPGELLGWRNPGSILYARVAKDWTSAPSDFVALTVPPVPHNTETSVVGLGYNDGAFNYSAVRIVDNFRININRQFHVVIRKYDSDDNEIASSAHTVTVNNNGFNLSQSAINAAVRSFTDEEYLVISVYRNNTMQDELSSQEIRPTVFRFN
jgi:hypothetical protein